MDEKAKRIQLHNDTFLAALQEFSTSMVETFNNDPTVIKSITQAHQNVMDLKSMSAAFPSVVQEYINKWKEATNGEFIWIKDAEHLIAHVRILTRIS